MHASIDQLLSLRDGEPVDAEIIRHAENCSDCAAELARLRRIQQRMESLPQAEPPAMAWEQIQARTHSQPVPGRARVTGAAAAAVIVAVISGLTIRHLDSTSQPPLASAGGERPPVADVVPLEHLVAQSRELDEMLQYLPERPSVERVAMAATIDSIEQRVQWLDQQLSYAPDTGLNDAQTYRLWRERVDLMDSLVKVRYAEGGSRSF
ncbi:MAG TPA: hypothetical protein VKB34_20945 [Povalibacter sp.]|nr:hypothetical protein [Povalibacter sp.]